MKKLTILSMDRGNLLIPLKRFTGIDEFYIIDFINQFERYTKFYCFEKEKTALFFPLCLDDLAYQYYETLPAEIQMDYDSTKTAFVKKFQDNQIKRFLRTEALYSRKMKPNESLDQYSYHILNEARRLEISERMKLFIYINGLPSDLKEHVLLQDPVNFEEARRAAEDKEYIRDAIITKTSRKEESITNIQCNTEKRPTPKTQTHYYEVKETIWQENQRTKCFRCRNFGHVARNCKSMARTQCDPERNGRCSNFHHHTRKNQPKMWLAKIKTRKDCVVNDFLENSNDSKSVKSLNDDCYRGDDNSCRKVENNGREVNIEDIDYSSREADINYCKDVEKGSTEVDNVCIEDCTPPLTMESSTTENKLITYSTQQNDSVVNEPEENTPICSKPQAKTSVEMYHNANVNKIRIMKQTVASRLKHLLVLLIWKMFLVINLMFQQRGSDKRGKQLSTPKRIFYACRLHPSHIRFKI